MDTKIDYSHRLLPTQRSQRPAVPAHVWDLSEYRGWREEIWTLIEDFADARVRRAFLKNPPTYVVSDDLRWLDRIIAEARDIEIDSKAELADRLRKRFRALRCVHGTRTAELESFYGDGLKPMVPEMIHDQARAIYLSGDFPELAEIDLQRAIAQVGTNVRGGRLYFECNEKMLRRYAGHYMLYGSEYLVAIARNLPGLQDYANVLKTRGTPTLFVCDVPLDLVDHSVLMEFSGYALQCVFQELLEGEDFAPDPMLGAGFCIWKVLQPEHIVGHCHPEISYDPIAHWR